MEDREEVKEELNPKQDELKGSVSKVVLAIAHSDSSVPKNSSVSKQTTTTFALIDTG